MGKTVWILTITNIPGLAPSTYVFDDYTLALEAWQWAQNRVPVKRVVDQHGNWTMVTSHNGAMLEETVLDLGPQAFVTKLTAAH